MKEKEKVNVSWKIILFIVLFSIRFKYFVNTFQIPFVKKTLSEMLVFSTYLHRKNILEVRGTAYYKIPRYSQVILKHPLNLRRYYLFNN